MSTKTDALANVYARSLYELAQEAGGAEKVAELADELEQICECARADRAFREFLASPIIDHAARGTALQRIFQDRITDLGLRFLLVLNDKGRLGHLEAIYAAYDGLIQEAHGRVEVDVFTAAPLGGEQKEIIAQRIRDALGKEPVLHAYTDQGMLGGIRLQIGDQLVDGSVATRLRRIRQGLMTSGTEALRTRMDDIVQEDGA